MKFGEKLSFLRKQQDMTQQELAERLGVSRQAVSRWERMTSDPSTENLICIGKLFDVSVDSLLNDGVQIQEGGCPCTAVLEEKTHKGWRDKLKQTFSIFNRRIYLVAALIIYFYEQWMGMIYNSSRKPSALVTALTGLYVRRAIGPLFSFFFVLYLILLLFDCTKNCKKFKIGIHISLSLCIALLWIFLHHRMIPYSFLMWGGGYFALFAVVAAFALRILQKRKEVSL